MLIKKIVKHDGYSGLVKRRGIRRVAKKAGISPGNLSKYVNNKKVCNEKTLEKIRVACNEVSLEMIREKESLPTPTPTKEDE